METCAAALGNDARGVAEGHRPRDDGDRGRDGFKVARVSLFLYRVTTLGSCGRGRDGFRVARVSLIV